MPLLRSSYVCVFALCAILRPSSYAADTPSERPERTYLHKNWQIQSSCEVKASGEQISLASFEAKGWHKADVPATVVGALSPILSRSFSVQQRALCQSRHAGGKPVSLLVVVSHGVQFASQLSEQEGLAEFPGN